MESIIPPFSYGGSSPAFCFLFFVLAISLIIVYGTDIIGECCIHKRRDVRVTPAENEGGAWQRNDRVSPAENEGFFMLRQTQLLFVSVSISHYIFLHMHHLYISFETLKSLFNLLHRQIDSSNQCLRYILLELE